MQLLNELLSLREKKSLQEAYKNHLGEVEYTSYDSWRRACKKVDANVWFDGDRDICNAFVGTKPYKRKETRAIGEWDGAKGSVFQDAKKIAAAASTSKEEDESAE